MVKILFNQNNFSTGELSPRMYGRSDLGSYVKSLKTTTNCKVFPHGPVNRRTGSKYIGESKDSSKASRFIKFQFSADDSFILEFGDLYIRFYQNGGQVQEADVTITGITKANPGVVTATAHGFVNGDQVVITGVLGMTELNTRRFTVANKTANTFELSGEDTTNHTTYSSGGVANRIYTIASPYDETEIVDLQYTQFGNDMYFTHPDFAPRVLTRTSTADWAIDTLSTSPEPTIEIGFLPATSVTPAAATGLAVNFTASGATFLTGDAGRQIVNLSGTGRASITSVTSTTVVVCDIIEDFPDTSAIASPNWKLDLSPFEELTPSGLDLGSIITLTATALTMWRSTDVGRYILINNGVVQITKFTSTTVVEGEVVKSLASSDATQLWSLEDPAWSSTRGFPRAVGLYEQRLIFGGTSTEPQTLWMSEVGIFTSFGIGSGDSDALNLIISSNEVNQINWMRTSRSLIVGTSGSEVTIDSGSAGPITPSSRKSFTRTYYGSKIQQTVAVGGEILFVQQTEKKIRSFRFDFNIDNYTGDDLLILNEHMPEVGIKEVAYAQEPDSNIFAVLNDGSMLVGTYVREQKVLGWTRYTTNGLYESVQSITENGVDAVYVMVNRTINGSTARYVEIFDTGDGVDNLDSFIDSSLTYSLPKIITGITAASPAVVTSTAHGFSNADTIKIIDVVGMTELNNRTFIVANKTANTFELTSEDSSAYTAYSSGGEAHETVTVISGLDHLEGKIIQLRDDGAVHPDKTVYSGSVTLDSAAIEVVARLSYTTTIETLDLEYTIGQGSMQGQRSRFTIPILKLYRSTLPIVNGEFIPSRSAAFDMDEKVPLFSGTVKYRNLNWDDKLGLTITLSEPLPLTLIGIFGVVEGSV